ncbi:MAG: arabinose isomerase [Acidobacteria bacterium]|nr:MAG: arabinose isomerase [Acidobacteriota bacterium]
MTREKEKAQVGVFGIGLAAYWPQFPGLKERLEGYQRKVEQRIGEWATVISGGLVDDAAAARQAGDVFAGAGVDLVFCYVGTYATSSQVLPVVQRAKAPVVVLNLQPRAALDYSRTDTGEWLANCSACCVPEISFAFARAGIAFHVVTGMLEPEPDVREPWQSAWKGIREWCEAAAAVRNLRRARIGFLGHVYPGMLDMYSDFTQHHAQTGAHIEVLEMCDLDERVNAASEPEIRRKEEEVRGIFQISEDSPSDPLAKKPTAEEMAWACRVAVGLERLADDFNLDGLTYYYRGLAGNRYEQLGAGLIVGCSLLTAGGIPCSGEGDLKNCQAMKIMDLLEAGGSFTEFYALDFREGLILMGHDGPFHLAIAEGRPILRGLGRYHGKRGHGVGVEASVRKGPITILGLTQAQDGSLKLLAAAGESVPGERLQIGNTNSRLRFQLEPTPFFNAWCGNGPTHHCALGVGHVVDQIAKVSSLLGMELTVIGKPA